MEIKNSEYQNRALVIGDFHFGVKTNSTQWLEFMLEYLTKDIRNLIIERSPNKVIFLGDLFDIRYSTNTLIGIKVKDAFRNLLKEFSNIDFHILAGNHDYYSNKKEDMHYNVYEMVFGKEFYSCYGNFHVYTEAPFLDGDGNMYLPWFFTEDEELFYQTMSHFKNDNIKRIFCHTDLCTWDNSRKIAKGNVPVYAGHIHTPWKDEENQLYNLGSALSFTFNDVNEQKSIYELNGTHLESYLNKKCPTFKRYYNDEIFGLTTFSNCFVQLYIDKDLVNKAQYIEKCKELKTENPGISIRVVTIDKDFISDENSGIDMNQDIKKYIETNIPDGLSNKYNIVKSKIESKKK